MSNIIDNALNGKCSLQTIPHPAIYTIDIYKKATHMFEDSLQDVYIDNSLLEGLNGMQNALTHLARFQNLVSLAVDLCNADMLSTIVNITVELPKIKELTIYIPGTNNSASAWNNSRQDLNQQSITRTRTIETLKLFTHLEDCIGLILSHFDDLKSIEAHFEDEIYNRSFFIEMIHMLTIAPHFIFEFGIDDRSVDWQDIVHQIPDDVEVDSVSTSNYEFDISGDGMVESFTSYWITLKR